MEDASGGNCEGVAKSRLMTQANRGAPAQRSPTKKFPGDFHTSASALHRAPWLPSLQMSMHASQKSHR